MYILPLGIIIEESDSNGLKIISLVAIEGEQVMKYNIQRKDSYNESQTDLSNVYNIPPSRTGYKFKLAIKDRFAPFSKETGDVQTYHYIFKKVEVVKLDRIISELQEDIDAPLEGVEKGAHYDEKTYIVIVEDNENVDIKGDCIIKVSPQELQENIEQLKFYLKKYRVYK